MVFGIPFPPIGTDLHQSVLHIAIGQLHAFGMSGGARRVELDKIIVKRALHHRIFGRTRVTPLLEIIPCRVAAIHRNNFFHCRAVGHDAFNKRDKILTNKHHFSLGIVQYIGHFWASETGIDAHHNGTYFLRTEKQLEITIRILAHKGNACVWLNALFKKRLRHLACARI